MALFAVAHMQDIIGFLAPLTLLGLAFVHAHRVSVPRRPPLETLLLAGLLLFLVANVLIHRSLEGISAVGFLASHGRIFYVLAIFAVFLVRRPSDRTERVLYRSAFWMAVLVAMVSLYSWYVSPLTLAGVPLSGERLNGLLGGPNPTAGSLGLVLVLFCVGVMHRKDPDAPFRPRVHHWLGAGLVFAAILLTSSRGYLLGLLVLPPLMILPVLWGGLRRGRIRLRAMAAVLVTAVAVGVAGIALASRLRADVLNDPTLLIRFALFARAWDFGLESPLFGVGLGTFERSGVTLREVIPGVAAVRESGDYLPEIIPMTVDGGLHAHNVFLQVFAEMGLLGGVLMLALLACVWRRARTLPKRAGPDVPAGLLGTARFNGRLALYLVAFGAVAGLTSGYTLFSPSTAWLLYVAAARLVRQHGTLAARAAGAGVGPAPRRSMRLALAEGGAT